jgi:hypothetical protein
MSASPRKRTNSGQSRYVRFVSPRQRRHAACQIRRRVCLALIDLRRYGHASLQVVARREVRHFVRCGSIASIPRCPRYVRLCSKSGDKADMGTLRVRAIPDIAPPLTRSPYGRAARGRPRLRGPLDLKTRLPTAKRVQMLPERGEIGFSPRDGILLTSVRPPNCSEVCSFGHH